MRILFIPGKPLYHPSLVPLQSLQAEWRVSPWCSYRNLCFPHKWKTWLFINDKPGQHIKKQRHHSANKSLSSQSYGFSSGEIWMWELDHKEGWESKNWCFCIMCWRRPLRVPWTSRRSNQSILKEINPNYSLEGVILNLQYFGHLMWRADSLEKTLMLRKTESEKRVAEGEMVRQYHQLNEYELEQTPENSRGQGRLVCFSPRGCEEWNTT